MARLLADGGFAPEALAPLHEAAEEALASLAEAMDGPADSPIPPWNGSGGPSGPRSV